MFIGLLYNTFCQWSLITNLLYLITILGYLLTDNWEYRTTGFHLRVNGVGTKFIVLLPFNLLPRGREGISQVENPTCWVKSVEYPVLVCVPIWINHSTTFQNRNKIYRYTEWFLHTNITVYFSSLTHNHLLIGLSKYEIVRSVGVNGRYTILSSFTVLLKRYL